eukprot:75927-Prymnesium_polylepis.1
MARVSGRANARCVRYKGRTGKTDGSAKMLARDLEHTFHAPSSDAYLGTHHGHVKALGGYGCSVNVAGRPREPTSQSQHMTARATPPLTAAKLTV